MTTMTTTKIDTESLEKLRMLAGRENRSAPAQLKILIESAWKSNPAIVSENEQLMTMMDDIADHIEAGSVTEAAEADANTAKAAGVISWGMEDDRVIGTLVDGTRIDVTGTPI